MPLFIVSTPIGNPDDISARALNVIRESEFVIGEEKKVTLRFLKHHKLTGRPVDLLNEHSDEQDLEFLFEQCKTKKVALVSDCGTPGFCDPGALLVKKCRDNDVPVTPVPGASSLMALLAVAGYRLDEFLFKGFLPGNTQQREKEWVRLRSEKIPFIIMDTPYRLQKTLEELKKFVPNKTIVFGYRLTFEDELVLEFKAGKPPKELLDKKGEFIAVVL